VRAIVHDPEAGLRMSEVPEPEPEPHEVPRDLRERRITGTAVLEIGG